MTFDTDLSENDLFKAGYKKQHNGFIRNIGKDGRFHAKLKINIKKRVKFIDIHFDFWSKNSLHPLVFYTPNMLKEELNRIKTCPDQK